MVISLLNSHYILMLSSNILSLIVNLRVRFQGLISFSFRCLSSKFTSLCISGWTDPKLDKFYKLWKNIFSSFAINICHEQLFIIQPSFLQRRNLIKILVHALHLFYGNNFRLDDEFLQEFCLEFGLNSAFDLENFC